MEETGLYIHIPFCRSKCPYCAFVSSECRDEGPPAQYLEAISRQMIQISEHPWCRDREFTTLFVGGGTPTVYSGPKLAGFFKQCLGLFPFVADPEVSIETNPNTVSDEKFSCLREAGVNRLSIGVQSFSEELLAVAGRTHSCADASRAVELAREAGFENINLDFIYGLPGQTVPQWRETLVMAAAQNPEHLALYEMTIEPETPYGLRAEKGELDLPDHDEVAEMEAVAQEQLKSAGYERYEISNYARQGRECRHNINYWQNGSYLGIGAGAVSCFDGFRVKNVSDYQQYMHCVKLGVTPFQEGEALSVEAGFRESVITGLRMISGVSVNKLKERYGLEPRQYYGKVISRFLEQDMIYFDGDFMRLTTKSLPVANQVLAELV